MQDEITGLTFGRWLINQTGRGAWWAALAKAAATDRGFPKDAGPDQVRERLEGLGADPDLFEMLEDAERTWRSSPQ